MRWGGIWVERGDAGLISRIWDGINGVDVPYAEMTSSHGSFLTLIAVLT